MEERALTDLTASLLPFTAHRVEYAPGEWTMEVGDDALDTLRTRLLVDQAGGSIAGLRILDLGCLEGGYCAAFSRLGAAEVVGVEARPTNIARCEFVKSHAGLENVTFVHADVKEITSQELGCFDATFAAGILYHLDDPYDFLRRVSELTTDLLVLDTHVAQHDSWNHGCSPRLSARTFGGTPYVGRDAFEYDSASSAEAVDELLWAAYGNPTSFWLTEDSLVDMLTAVGFPYVLKARVRRPYYCGLGCTSECRVLLVARKEMRASARSETPGDDVGATISHERRLRQALAVENARLTEAVHMYERSRSWRLTRPMRAGRQVIHDRFGR
jgi:SAM-dependent methyltransferase